MKCFDAFARRVRYQPMPATMPATTLTYQSRKQPISFAPQAAFLFAGVAGCFASSDNFVSCKNKTPDFSVIDEFLSSCYSGNVENVRKLMVNHREIHAVRNADGWTPLLLAAVEGHTEVVAYLLSSGADVEAHLDGEDSAIMLAAIAGNRDIVVMLASEGGAAVDARRSNGTTALMLAAANGHEDTVEALIILGADIETCDRDGKKALDFAARYRHKRVVAVLLQRGAQLEAGNDLSGMRWGNVNQGTLKS